MTLHFLKSLHSGGKTFKVDIWVCGIEATKVYALPFPTSLSGFSTGDLILFSLSPLKTYLMTLWWCEHVTMWWCDCKIIWHCKVCKHCGQTVSPHLPAPSTISCFQTMSSSRFSIIITFAKISIPLLLLTPIGSYNRLPPTTGVGPCQSKPSNNFKFPKDSLFWSNIYKTVN